MSSQELELVNLPSTLTSIVVIKFDAFTVDDGEDNVPVAMPLLPEAIALMAPSEAEALLVDASLEAAACAAATPAKDASSKIEGAIPVRLVQLNWWYDLGNNKTRSGKERATPTLYTIGP